MAVTANTTIQLHVPDHLRGRVMSVYTTVFSGSVPVGGLIMGFIASRVGVPAALFLGGTISLLVAVLAIPVYRRITASTRAASRPRAGAVALAAATADMGAIDPEGRSAGSVASGARPR